MLLTIQTPNHAVSALRVKANHYGQQLTIRNLLINVSSLSEAASSVSNRGNSGPMTPFLRMDGPVA